MLRPADGTDDGVASLRRCVKLSEERGTRRELGLAQLLLGKHLPARPEAERLRATGRALLEEIGAKRDLALAD